MSPGNAWLDCAADGSHYLPPVSCDGSGECISGQCDANLGCTSQAVASGICDDGNACTANDACKDGSCIAGKDVTCDDGDACTLQDFCVVGKCGGTPKNCDDGNPCTDDACAAGACNHTGNAAPCDDGNPCTVSDKCGTGGCSGQTSCGDGICCGGESMATCPQDCELYAWPAGTFAMGSKAVIGNADEAPQHQVTLGGFHLDYDEVTVSQYKAFYAQLSPAQQCTGENSDVFTCGQPATSPGCNWGTVGAESEPINCVDWYQASVYCAWVGGRLPTEAEWEYAARNGGKDQEYPWGNQAASCSLASMGKCGLTAPAAVCSKSNPTAPGACDLAGNVAEWTADFYGAYTPDNQTNPLGPKTGASRVIRGGSWLSTSADLRSASRSHMAAKLSDNGVGFRCAK